MMSDRDLNHGVEHRDDLALDAEQRRNDAIDAAEDMMAALTAPHEQALAEIYGCDPVQIWEACEVLRLKRLLRND